MDVECISDVFVVEVGVIFELVIGFGVGVVVCIEFCVGGLAVVWKS